MATRTQLLSLHRRMSETQRAIIDQAAEAGAVPTRQALSQIADLEQAMLAVETMIEETASRRVGQDPVGVLEAAE